MLMNSRRPGFRPPAPPRPHRHEPVVYLRRRILMLAGISGTRAEIQSRTVCQYGVLHTSITSSNWKSQSVPIEDSSFGFEHFTGTNGKCHYAVHFVANGNLGLLRAVPKTDGSCEGDPPPENQKYIPITNWDSVRNGARGRIDITLIWTPTEVTLSVSDGGRNIGLASYTGEVIPTIPLKIRLNANCMKRTEGDTQ